MNRPPLGVERKGVWLVRWLARGWHVGKYLGECRAGQPVHQFEPEVQVRCVRNLGFCEMNRASFAGSARNCYDVYMTILLVPHDPSWSQRYLAERAAILAACGTSISAVHHVGSTSIQGIAAKPIIDILAIISRPEDGLACVRPLECLGYKYRGENGMEGRLYFKKPQAFHVHMYPADHPDAGRILRFRDYLRSHPAEAARYEALKQELSKRFATDRGAYTMAKGSFCAQINQLALQTLKSASGET